MIKLEGEGDNGVAEASEEKALPPTGLVKRWQMSRVGQERATSTHLGCKPPRWTPAAWTVVPPRRSMSLGGTAEEEKDEGSACGRQDAAAGVSSASCSASRTMIPSIPSDVAAPPVWIKYL